MFTLSLMVTISLQVLFERSGTRDNNISARQVVPDSRLTGRGSLSFDRTVIPARQIVEPNAYQICKHLYRVADVIDCAAFAVIPHDGYFKQPQPSLLSDVKHLGVES